MGQWNRIESPKGNLKNAYVKNMGKRKMINKQTRVGGKFEDRCGPHDYTRIHFLESIQLTVKNELQKCRKSQYLMFFF